MEKVMEKKKTCISCGKELVGHIQTMSGGKAFNVCDEKCGKDFLREMKDTRSDKLEKSELDLKMLKRELAYKQAQLSSDSIEKNESKIYNILCSPIDDKKPKFVLENERDMIVIMIDRKEKEIKNIKELEEKDGTA